MPQRGAARGSAMTDRVDVSTPDIMAFAAVVETGSFTGNRY
jgi:hypothetical protein